MNTEESILLAILFLYSYNTFVTWAVSYQRALRVDKMNSDWIEWQKEKIEAREKTTWVGPLEKKLAVEQGAEESDGR